MRLVGGQRKQRNRPDPEVMSAKLLSFLARDSPAQIWRTSCYCLCNGDPRRDVCHHMRERDPMTDRQPLFDIDRPEASFLVTPEIATH
jgi:hypothetical protein